MPRPDAPRRPPQPPARGPVPETAPDTAAQALHPDHQARRERATLLRDFDRSPLTKANFCALKGMAVATLDAQLTLARQEAAEWAAAHPVPPRREGGDEGRDHRNPRDRREPRAPRGAGPRDERHDRSPGRGAGPGRADERRPDGRRPDERRPQDRRPQDRPPQDRRPDGRQGAPTPRPGPATAAPAEPVATPAPATPATPPEDSQS